MSLREVRQKKGFSQEELAKKAGLSAVAISLIETGKVAPQARTRMSIEKVLGERINWLTTKGLHSFREGQMTTWEAVEQTFRKALHEINGLQQVERLEFVKLAKQYLEDFKEGMDNIEAKP